MTKRLRVEPPSLADSREKLGRARKHLSDFEAGVAESLATAGTNSYVVTYEPDQLCHIVWMQVDTFPDPAPFAGQESRAEEMRLVLGDVLHNARSALDYVAWQLARLHLDRDPTGGEAPKIQFPLARSAAGFGGLPVVRFISSEAFDAMARYQPYVSDLDGGKVNPLAVLRDLSNSDKHRLPIWTMRYMKLDLSFCFDPPVNEHRIEPRPPEEEGASRALALGDRVLMQRLLVEPRERAARTSVTVDPQPTLEISLSAADHHYGSSEVRRLVERVESVVDDFDRFFHPER